MSQSSRLHISRIALSAFLVPGFAAVPLHADVLLASWEFDAGDVSGSEVRTTAGIAPIPAVLLQGDAAVVDGALALDGTGDYLEYGNDLTALRTQASMTIAAWVQPDFTDTGLRRIVEHEDNTYFWAESGLYQYTTHGTPNGNDGRARSITAPTQGVWQHVLVTFTGGGPASIYIDGVLEGTSSTPQNPIPNNMHTFQIGARRSASMAATNFWQGLLDDVALWDYELAPSEIEALAGVGAGGYEGRVTPSALQDDTDGDGMPDSYEDLFDFLDPNNPADADEDEDGDGLTNLEEYMARTDPGLADTDGDGLSDGEEINVYSTDPLNPDTDGDTIGDGEEVTPGLDGFVTDPNNVDTDGDGFWDDYEIFNTAAGFDPTIDDSEGDFDGDGLSNAGEVLAGTDPLLPDSDFDGLTDGEEVNVYGTNPLEADSDGDFLDDIDEIQVHMTDPNNPDSDGDGLLDGDEIDFFQTDPNEADTDGDGFNDGVEIGSGTDPLDALDFPTVDLLDGLFVYYTFDRADVDGDAVRDLAGDPLGPFDGTKVNGGPSPASGLFGEAVEFLGGTNNGDWEYLDLSPHAATLGTLTEGSIAAWVKTPSDGLVTDVLTIFAISDEFEASSEVRYWISNGGAFGTGTLAFGVREDNTGLGSLDSRPVDTLLDGEWHHVAVSYSAETFTARIFVDGVSVGTGPSGFFADVTGVNTAGVGRNKDNTEGGGQWFFDGTMDDFAIWSRPLNAAEVAEIYAQGLAGNPIGGGTPAEGPRITEVSYDSGTGTATIFFEAIPGREYGLEFSTDLVNWDPIDDATAAGESASFSDNFANMGEPAGFYRVRLLD